MERTALLMQWALSPKETPAGVAEMTGAMSTNELREVLPWLLSNAAANRGDEFWSKVGSLFTFEQLECLSDELDGHELTPLIQANLSTWSATRAFAGLNAGFEYSTPAGNSNSMEAESGEVTVNGDELAGTATAPTIQPSWRFESTTIGLAVDSHFIRVTNDGRKLRGRPGSSALRWSNAIARLGDSDLQSVSISGVERAFRVEARGSEDIREDVEKVVESVSDTYFASGMEVLLPGIAQGDQAAPLVLTSIDFGRGVVDAKGGVQLGALTRVAANILIDLEFDQQLQLIEDGEDAE